MITLWYDTRYALRQLIKHPGFTVAVVLILSIGIGANTAVFSVVNAVLFKSLPYDEADKIVMIREQNLQQGLDKLPSSHDTLAYWRTDQMLLMPRIRKPATPLPCTALTTVMRSHPSCCYP